MTRLLQQLVEATSKLSSEDQDALAARWLEELQDDAAWDRAFSSSADVLAKMADEVRSKIAAGRIEKIGINEL